MVQIELTGPRVFLDGEDVSQEIRRPSITKSIRHIADNPLVRQSMVDMQRKWSDGRDVVTEGRDQGTVAFPSAECKIFLTASSEERARRRVVQLIELGMDADFHDILEQQNRRDADDTKRELGGLRLASDSIKILTDGMSEEQVLQHLIEIVQGKQLSLSGRMQSKCP